MKDYVVVDLEMTGLNAKNNKILEIGAIKIKDKIIVETFEELIDPQMILDEEIIAITGITNEMVQGKRTVADVLKDYLKFEENLPLVGHNIIFDYSFLKQEAVNERIAYEKKAVDTLKLARKFLEEPQKKTLTSLCDYFSIPQKSAHRALSDAMDTWELYKILEQKFAKDNTNDFIPKDLIYKAKRQTPATAAQKRYLKEILKYHKIMLNLSWETLTRSEASKITDQLLSDYGRIQREEKSL